MRRAAGPPDEAARVQRSTATLRSTVARTSDSRRRRAMRPLMVLCVAAIVGSCGSGGESGSAPTWLASLRQAVAAVEAELGEGQEFFEVTANPQLTNVFVAVDGGTAAVPYVYRDGELLDPGPTLAGASGRTFTAGAIRFDEGLVLTQVERELPGATVDALSVEGGPGGAVRYLVAVRSEQGGALDVEVGPAGEIIAVVPV